MSGTNKAIGDMTPGAPALATDTFPILRPGSPTLDLSLTLANVRTLIAPTSADLTGASGGAFTSVHVGSGLTLAGGTLSSSAGGGTVTQVSTSGLVTGGPITGAGTISLASIAAASLIGNPGTAAGVPTAFLLGSHLAFSGGTLDAVGYISGNQTITLSGVVTGAGTTAITTAFAAIAAGRLLANAGTASAAPAATGVGSHLVFAGGSIDATGFVTSIIAGTGLAGGTITTAGTVSLATIAANSLLGNPGTATAAPSSAIAIGSGLTLSTAGTLSSTAGGGSVTSVAETFTGGLISVAGSPITGAGTLALTVAGTSGGVVYFNSGTSWASSGALTLHALTIGGGAAGAPTPLASLGTTTTVLHGNASGDPTFAAVDLTADVTGRLPFANVTTIAASSLVGNPGTAAGALQALAIGSNLTLSTGGTLSASAPGTGTVTSVATSGLVTGGTITSAGTISLSAIAAGALVGNAGTVSAVPAAIPLGSHLTYASGTLDATGYISANQTITLSGDVTGAGTTAITTTATKFNGGTSFGSMAGQAASSVTITGGTITGMPTPSAASDVANKSYVDATVAGLQIKPTATVATAAALPSNIYANGASGVGATITVIATGTLTVDGHVTALNDLVLVKNEVTAANNGLYLVTTAGAIGVAAVLTRSVDMNVASEFSGAFVPVGSVGTANANSLWLANPSGAVTVGTTAIPFTQLNGATDLVPGANIGISGNTISVIATLPTSVGGTGLSAFTANTLIYASGTATLAGATVGPNVILSGGSLSAPPRMLGVMVETAGTLGVGTYDLGPVINGGTVLNSYAHVGSGTITYTGAIGAPGTYTAITGLTALTASSATSDTIGTATAANVLSAGQHLFVQVPTATVGGVIFFSVKTP